MQGISLRFNRLIPVVLLVAVGLAPALAATPTGMIRQYQFQPRADGMGHELVLKNVPRPEPGQHEVLVRVRAASLNTTDTYILDVPPGQGRDFAGGIPLSDGAGEVIAIGNDVTRFAIGDRVAGIFLERWIDGDRTQDAFMSIRGANAGGMLSEMVVSSEESLVRIPDYLSYEEAATLPCTGVTAWTSLFKYGGLKAGEYVLLEGTGGVSSFGLLFAVAAGARPIITSSSDARLDRAGRLGAIGTVNYRTNPNWQQQVRALTGGAGVKHVLEVGGKGTLGKAIEALAFDGHIALIGELSGIADQVPLAPLFGAGAHLTAVFVGSRADFEAMNAFIARHEIHPVIDRVFEFEQAPAAFEFMLNGDYMGKIVIRL